MSLLGGTAAAQVQLLHFLLRAFLYTLPASPHQFEDHSIGLLGDATVTQTQCPTLCDCYTFLVEVILLIWTSSSILNPPSQHCPTL